MRFSDNCHTGLYRSNFNFRLGAIAATTSIRKTCSKGHQYYKSSSCPVCSVCAQKRKPADGLQALVGAPARRALVKKINATLEQLSTCTETEIAALHGMGKSTLSKLKEALTKAGLSFKEGSNAK